VGDVLLAVEEGEVLSDRAERTVRAVFEHALLDVTWSRYETGQRGPEPHVHHRHVDAFYVVEGALRFGVGPVVEPVDAPAGTFVLVPPDVVHTFANASGATARWLNFHAPSTGFIEHLRGVNGFDSDDPPADGGRSAAEAIVGSGGRVSQLAVSELPLEPRSEHEPETGDGVDCYFVLDGVVDADAVRAGSRTWMAAPRRLWNPGPGPARLLRVRAPGS
jgi:mannose-6-phosphate isomerase-like protein (cupin superfamily)